MKQCNIIRESIGDKKKKLKQIMRPIKFLNLKKIKISFS